CSISFDSKARACADIPRRSGCSITGRTRFGRVRWSKRARHITLVPSFITADATRSFGGAWCRSGGSVGSTTVHARAIAPWLTALLGALLAVAMLFTASPAQAAPGDDQEQTPYYFGGVITFEGEPVAGVTMSIEGNGFNAETEMDAEGRWRLYVPEKEEYVLTVDENTLPDGVIVDPEQLPEGIAPRSGTTASFDVEFGLTGSKIVNLFLGEGERVTTSFFDQFVERLINGLNFAMLLALASIGLSLIYCTTGLTNFAHAELVTFGAVAALVFALPLSMPMWLAVPLSVIAGMLVGYLLDLVMW